MGVGSEVSQFKPGHKPTRRSLHAHVRDLCDGDPKVFLSVLMGISLDARAKDNDRIAATRELLDRGWGKSVSLVLVEEGGPGSSLDGAIRDLLDEIRGQHQLQHPDVEQLDAGEAA